MTAEPRPARALVFPDDPDLPVTAETVDASQAGIWRFVGGQPEVVHLGEGIAAAGWCHAYGKTSGLAPNRRAAAFVDALRPGYARADTIMGPVLVVGFDDQGQAADVPAELEATALPC